MIKLPIECLLIIFNNFQNDSKSLYSCLLVNRYWCRIVVPILWRNIGEKLGNRKLINTCLLSLNAEEQVLLIPFKIFLSNYSKPLFEYTSYTTSVCRYLNGGIISWLNENDYTEVKHRWECNTDTLVNAVKYSLISMFLRTNERFSYLEVFGFIDNNNKLIKNLCGNNTINSLYLYENWIDSEGIAEILCNNTTLTSLKLNGNNNGNNIGIKGAKALAKALHTNTTLTSLNLSRDNIGSEGGKALANALYLSVNDIGIEGGKMLVKALCKNTTLISLNLSCNGISFDERKELTKTLHKKNPLIC
ncbi:hypothetical protein F8M41_000348 [Gigaspora margarita]|uniref:F-box domain-containing protein n=1 Tax=Gigaspora margarita TaxID=4874 RepID=A0A8H3XHR2_GIGMA|nr:hypothetical protein F8M41_000348 [Gigaspora margarita]